MKKIILSLAAVLAFALTSDAQTRKGTVLLGAGSQLTNAEWMKLKVTPQVGYFVQDGVAIGALINFQSEVVKDSSSEELKSSVSEIGIFSRYYVSNNLFAEVGLSSLSSSNEFTDTLTITVSDQTITDNEAVIENSDSKLNINLGVGYTIVWREHFAIEPKLNLVFSNGDRKVYDGNSNEIGSSDLSGTHFNLGVNFSLFF